MPGMAQAMLHMELTKGVSGAIPIAIPNFIVQGQSPSENIAAVIRNDLQNSGRFTIQGGDTLQSGQSADRYRSVGAEAYVEGKIREVSPNRYEVTFQLRDTWLDKKPSQQNHALLSKTLTVSAGSLRPLAHHISDLVYEKLTGVRGVFSTRLAYIVVQRPAGERPRYILEVSDQDGYNPKPLLNSTDPIMSPAWSPDGRRVAYVSFENKRAAIYIETVATGARQRVSAFPGINGAPAWSPDGRKLALVLSHTGSPNIFIMDLGSRKLKQITHDWSINTEPSFTPDGRSIIFTSNRSGGPQIYQANLATGAVNRITYNGNYNARASMTPDGRRLVTLNRTSGLFNIAILDLDSGVFRILTDSTGVDNESPSIAPNGSMVLYGTLYGGQSVLAMASSDGNIQIRLPVRNGEVQDPAWSPWLS
ncbi:MAG: Tol-Pal system beta propeller repeat protein TolB [Gammaproteobacteria bacterium]|nr:Tol-Pal system beta propeller repeat protein TolB [Gammaproteobacteria bacterium]